MVRIARIALMTLVISAAATSASAIPFTSFSVFGDSLSDGGNAYLGLGGTVPFPPFPPGTITLPPFPPVPDAPYPRGALLPAFTNGPNWAEILGATAGLPVVPSLLGGSNFAFGAADTGPLPLVAPGPSPTVLAQFFGPGFPFFGGGPIDPNGLYAVWGGGNDVRRALEVYAAILAATFGDSAAALAGATAVVDAGVANLQAILEAAAAGGGKHIVSLNVPDIGLAPAMDLLPPGTDLLATGLAAAFNTGLAVAIDGIEGAYSIDVIELDMFTFVRQIAATPAAFGLSNSTDACLEIGGAGVCSDPDTYMFWDGVHPTSALHRLIAAQVYAAVIPVPPTSALLALGLLLIACCRRAGR